MSRLEVGKRPLIAAGLASLCCLAILTIPQLHGTPNALEEVLVFPGLSQRELARQYDIDVARQQILWGGQGAVTTGTSVDGRPTVPGLHTDCIPGVLRSDCSPAQEDGAWSTEAAGWLDSHTNGGHSNKMQKIQDDVDAAFAARDKFLDDCLSDASLCNGRRTDASPASRMAGTYGDQPTWGSRTHPWAPEQGADFGQYNNDGHWNHISLPSGTHGDGGLVSDSYYASGV
eukprot:CAMPEP_0181321606 /NCGR_PEP_ID=MMETSP1101-20121128/18782_1 /TAXON_ID=46948 /ORGANISM="Rhodomonas abbreviata, Strain Caron Lab Isolate" /LENGTH=229 /DNA_ID=CAMNT_0023429459 /DNA_START=12 /DNA_END=701 /DNA_ORIENTATION=+